MHEAVSEDTPVHRATVDQLPLDKYERMLEALRERRMIAFQAYTHAMQEKSRAKQDKAAEALAKRLAIVDKKMKAADKALAAVEDQLNKARANLIALEDERENEQQLGDSGGAGED